MTSAGGNLLLVKTSSTWLHRWNRRWKTAAAGDPRLQRVDALGLLDTQRFDGAVLSGAPRWRGVPGWPIDWRNRHSHLFVSAVYDQLVPQRHRRATFVAKPFHIDQLQKPSSRSWGMPARPCHALIADGGLRQCGATTSPSWRSAPPRESPSQLLRATLRISAGPSRAAALDQ
jgi:hypothetical protein